MTITYISLDPDSDGYDAIFIDNKLFMHGDEYHERISAKMDGIIEYLEFTKVDFAQERFDLFPADEVSIFDEDYMPKAKDTPEKYMKRMSKFLHSITSSKD